MCIVNFRTSADDIDGLPEFIARLGRETFAEMHQKTSAAG
jgi:hypothetical protein